MYAQLYEWKEKQIRFNPGRDIRFTLAVVIERIKGSRSRTSKQEDHRFAESIQLASLGFLIDHGHIKINDKNDLEFTCSPENLLINYRLFSASERALWARADALTLFIKMSPEDRLVFLADYLTNSIDSVMERYTSTLEILDSAILEAVGRSPGHTQRRYAMAINGSASLRGDVEVFSGVFGILPHIGYNPVEWRVEDMLERGVLVAREVTLEKRTKGLGLFLAER
ncbi:MAG: hypothetical protein HZC29_07585 [Thaumarchaeota archaeon]|nr:hypothetical protein [Nitrososphaerota archaeon]